MISDENEFEFGNAGANITELKEAGRMKPGSLIIMKDLFPCKVTSFSTAKTGKHGAAKAMVTAKDIFTDKQYEETFATGDMIPAPLVSKTEVTAITYDHDGALTLITHDSRLKEDMNLPTEAHLSDIAANIRRILDAGNK